MALPRISVGFDRFLRPAHVEDGHPDYTDQHRDMCDRLLVAALGTTGDVLDYERHKRAFSIVDNVMMQRRERVREMPWDNGYQPDETR